MNKTLRGGQSTLLELLHVLGGRRGSLDFQKLLFLYCQEQGESAPYDFIPYDYGAFSYLSYKDRRRLIELGFIADEEKHWVLTEAGRQAVSVGAPRLESIVDFASRWDKMSGNALVAETYRRFPYFATRSKSATNVLRNDFDTLAQIEQARPKAGKPGLVTIGYEGRSLDAYLGMLYRDGVGVLCDVRRNAISRKYGFSKRTLASSCAKIDIRYEHLPQLGIASEARRALHTCRDYDALFEKYQRTSLPRQESALSTISAWIADGRRVALTCFERHPSHCHRHCIAEALQGMTGKKLEVKHL